MTFRIGFPSIDFATFKTLKGLGFADTEQIAVGDARVSPIDYLTAMYQSAVSKSRAERPPRREYEYDAFRIDVTGLRNESPTTATYYIITWNDPKRGISSGRDTAVPPSIVSQWQATGKIKDSGVFPPEAVVDPMPFFLEVGKRQIRVEEHSTETRKFY